MKICDSKDKCGVKHCPHNTPHEEIFEDADDGDDCREADPISTCTKGSCMLYEDRKVECLEVPGA